jgi:hypothetical protein
MARNNLFKLEKLKIKAFSAVGRTPADFIEAFDVMFNPESFKQGYQIEYGRGQGIGSSNQTAVYSRNKPSDLNLKLVLDGTGVHEMGIIQLGGGKSVHQQVEEFLTLTFRMNGDIHQPNYLRLEWGILNFECLLASVDITYTSFDRDGKPLRAELDVTFISDTSAEKRQREESKTSPDLTHKRLVRVGDTLPLLTKEIYGSSEHYLYVAAKNALDDFRNLTPGQEIYFPPLDKG